MTLRQRAALRGCVVALFVFACRVGHTADLALNVDLDPVARRFEASAELMAAGAVAFYMHPSLRVTSVTLDGRRHEASRDTRNHWRIAAPKGSKLRIEYGGTLPALESLDHRAVLQNAVPMASAQGTFLPAGSGWYPQPAGAFSYTLKLTLPPGQRGLVAGTLTSEAARPDGRHIAEFEFREVADGIDLMAGPYVVRERLVPRSGAATLRLRTYFFPDIDPLAEGYLEDSARYIAMYSDAIGAYPFDSFSIVASPLPTGFGMPTLTYLGAEVLKLPFIRATSLGHEVLHNWWGNGVRVDYSQGNWSEGLTTFMADYAYKERDSESAARAMRLSWLRDFAAVPEDAQLPLSQFRSRTHGAEASVGYGKSAMLFLMARDEIGSEAFTAALRAFYARNKFKAASWNDLIAAFERASGRKLGAFLAQWIERRGGPSVDIEDAKSRSNGKSLTMSVTQSAPAYAMSVPIEISGAGKAEVRRVHIDRERQQVELALPFVAERVRLDPDLRIWRHLDASELSPILRQWIIATRPQLTILSPEAQAAAHEVAQSFFESAPHQISFSAASNARDPVLIAGLHSDVDGALAKLGLTRPQALAARGSAQVWTIAGNSARPIAVLSARDEAALRATARALPHLGGQSWLVFDGSRVIDRGIWPAAGRTIEVVRAQP